MELGYKLSSEEHGPQALVRNARRAEDAGFTFALISDHYHPWVDKQGESPFVWSVLGAIAQATERIRVGTGVTCPTIRVHPAVIAQAAATTAALMPGRFFFGVGSGENLNEHVLGDKWPPVDVRLEMLDEAIEVIRTLWRGKLTSHRGRYYTVENARIYSLPEQPPPILVAASGSKAAELAGRIGDGFVGTSPDKEIVETFVGAGGGDKPRYAEMIVCWGPDADKAKQVAHEWWPNAGLEGQLSQELALPSHFEQACGNVSADDLAESIPIGPDPDRHVASLQEYEQAGYTHVAVHQIGPDQDGFFDFFSKEILPRL